MTDPKIPESIIREAWHSYLTTGNMPASMKQPWFEHKALRPIVRMLPHSPRCQICYYPFEGIGGQISKVLLGIEQSKLNPSLCNLCERFATKYHGGVELEISMLFVDVRGSTSIAETISPQEFSKKINRFYRAATEVLYKTNGLVEKLLGDEVVGFYVPGFAGPDHARVAFEAGKLMLKTMGYGRASEPWIPVGVGVHTGIAYVGSVDAHGGATDIAILGDSVNTTARLVSLANPGELLVSQAACQSAGIKTDGMEAHHLQVKGRKQPVDAWAFRL
jgi:adenylate cyclase